MRMLVLGAGLQGSACAYDLLQNPEVTEVRLADLNVSHLPAFLHEYSGKRLIPTPLDVRDREAVLAVMRESEAVMSAIPYYFNSRARATAPSRRACTSATSAATPRSSSSRRSWTRGARSEGHHRRAGLRARAGNGEHPRRSTAFEQLDQVESVKIFVGGLPQHPEPPLNYQIVYSLEGVLDYYTTLSWVLRDGKRAQVTALSEREPVQFPKPVGELEAFHTAGGLSTMAFRYEGKIPTMEYKTLRYPGHARDDGGDPRARVCSTSSRWT